VLAGAWRCADTLCIARHSTHSERASASALYQPRATISDLLRISTPALQGPPPTHEIICWISCPSLAAADATSTQDADRHEACTPGERATAHGSGNLRLYTSDARGRVPAAEQQAQRVIAAKAGQAVVLPLATSASGALLWSIDEVVPARNKLPQDARVGAGETDESEPEGDAQVFVVARASWYAAESAKVRRVDGEGGEEGERIEHAGGECGDAESSEYVEGVERVRESDEELQGGDTLAVHAENAAVGDGEASPEEAQTHVHEVVSPLYLAAEACALIRKRFARDSAVQLQHFLCNATYDRLWREWREQRWEATRTLEDASFFRRALSPGTAGGGGRGRGNDTIGHVLRVMRSTSFASFLERCTGLKLVRARDGRRAALCQVRAFKQGCYARARPVVDHAARAAAEGNVQGVLEVVFCSADLGRVPGWRNGMYGRLDTLSLGGGGGQRGQGDAEAESTGGSGGREKRGSVGVVGGAGVAPVGFHYLGWAQGAGGELVYVSRSRGGKREVAGDGREGDGPEGRGHASRHGLQGIDVKGTGGSEWEGEEGPAAKHGEWEEEDELCALMCHGNSLSLVLAQGAHSRPCCSRRRVRPLPVL